LCYFIRETSSSESRLKKRTIILGIFLGFFICSTIVLAALFTREKIVNSKDDTCSTPYCIRAANYLLESIDPSVDPCEDFYQFSCGTWLKNARIPDDANAYNTFQILGQHLADDIADLLSSTPMNETEELQCVMNARLFYDTCINETKIETDGNGPVMSLINEFGGWPILQGSSWNSTTFNLSTLLFQLRQYNYNIIFRINSDIDEKNSSATNIVVGQGTLGLPQRRYFINETDIITAYQTFIKDLAKALTNDTTTIEQDAKDIFEFEKNISMYYWSNDERRARDNETIRTNVSELSQIFNTSFDFTAYLRDSYEYANVTLEDWDTVVVSELDFLTNASVILEQTSARILQNYFIWRFMMDRAGNMPRNIRSIQNQFSRVIQGTTAEQSRKITCGAYVNNNMGMVVSKLYITSYFDDNARNQSLDMIENIRTSFINMLDNSQWMDDTSKRKAIEKAQAIDQQIGYPDYLAGDNNTKLEEDYEQYIFVSTYIENIFKMLQVKSAENFQFLRKPVDRKAWGSLPPTVVNAFYDPSQNQITFPAGILQAPFFNKDAPKYLNYGGIGMVIGHEITHGFDDTGRQFDEDGNRIPWWTEDTIRQFDIKKQCIIDQYSNYSVPEIHMNSNGNQTQGEDIADNGGIKASFAAYQKWAKSNSNADKKLPGLKDYSSEQLFFMNFAHTWCIKMTDAYILNRVLTDPHSLGPFRVIGPTSNYDQFDKAFSCTPGQKNSRENKCTVW
jgi:membrane metallo-endopeptidase-like protein 1